MTSRPPIGRARSAALLACSLIVTIVPLAAAPFAAVAEPGIAPGSGAVVTAGAPLLVRAAPGWDAEVAYAIADGSAVTVWDVAQTAPDGTLWYPVDGGFVPVEAVTSLGALDGGVALSQEAETDEWTEPVASEGWVDPATGAWVEPAAEEWVEPAATESVDPAAAESVAPVAQEGWVDPTTGDWVEPVAQAPEGWVDPNTGEWVAPAAAETGWTDPNSGAWVEPAAAETGWTDPNTGAWVEPTAAETGWTDPNSGAWVEPAAEEAAAPAADWVEPAAAEMANTNSGGPEAWGAPIGTAYIAGSSGEGAVCRAEAARGSERLAVLAEGEAVEVRGEAVGEWQPVTCAGIGGYVHTSLIAWEPAAAPRADDGRRGNRGNAGASGTASASGTTGGSGNQIATFAMQYEGYPYVWAGEGPYAFDCSGFTKYVYLNTLGIDITHDLFQQAEMGTPVGRDELQPGDMVFFANTFRPGLSHNGIYIGDGLMIHAENEQTGVKVSDINSDYYSSRWYGAVRLT